MKKNIWVITGGIFGLLGVALGAFGAHGLKNILSPELLETYKIGVLYELIHAPVVFAIGLFGNSRFYRSAMFLSIGIILFSFSLYTYSLTELKSLAMITPIGGVSFLIGWVMIIVAGFSSNRVN
jgi:uncharacterized membrane protein YgdD (TMEM256/DUF423 family)